MMLAAITMSKVSVTVAPLPELSLIEFSMSWMKPMCMEETTLLEFSAFIPKS